MGEVITAKWQAFRAWKTGKGTRASYYAAKGIARRAVHHARHEADKEVYKNIDPKSSELYRLANQFRKENADVVGDKPVNKSTASGAKYARSSVIFPHRMAFVRGRLMQ